MQLMNQMAHRLAYCPMMYTDLPRDKIHVLQIQSSPIQSMFYN